MTAYLIDTNHAAQIMADQTVLSTRLASDRNTGDQFYTCITVLGELYFAAYASRRKQHRNRRAEHQPRDHHPAEPAPPPAERPPAGAQIAAQGG